METVTVHYVNKALPCTKCDTLLEKIVAVQKGLHVIAKLAAYRCGTGLGKLLQCKMNELVVSGNAL